MTIRTPHLRTLGAAMLGLALAAGTGCASTGSSGYSGGPSYGGNYGNTCQNCGTVTRITVGGESGKAGAVIGGIIGAVAGHEISAQTGGRRATRTSPLPQVRSPAPPPATPSRRPAAMATLCMSAWMTAAPPR